MAVKKKAARKKAPKTGASKTKKKVPGKKTRGKKAPQKKIQRKKPQKKKVQQKKTLRKKPARKKTSAKKPTSRPVARGVHIDLSPDLKARVENLAAVMGKSLDQLLIQAVNEFADTWEDHQRVIEALDEGDDRVQIVVGRD
tara:strand:- start:1412 stop:1834 length:423 start_codon:yes stop_codon:yes gene_type:complete